MVDRARPNRPQARPGATEANPQAGGEGQQLRTDRSGAEQTAGAHGHAGAMPQGQQSRTGASEAEYLNTDEENNNAALLWKLAVWSVTSVYTDDELYQRRAEVRQELMKLVDRICPP